MPSHTVTAFAAALLVAPLGVSSAHAETQARATAAAPTDPAAYVAKAGAGDLYEIESSRLALQKSGNAKVKQFAQMMIDHHQQTTAKVTEAAKASGMKPMAPKLEPKQAKMIADLRTASAANFDGLYITQQRKAHDEALMLHSTFAESGKSAPLKKVAGEAVPIVTRHQGELKNF